MVSNSLKGVVGRNFWGPLPPDPFFIFPQSFHNILPLHFTFAPIHAYVSIVSMDSITAWHNNRIMRKITCVGLT